MRRPFSLQTTLLVSLYGLLRLALKRAYAFDHAAVQLLQLLFGSARFQALLERCSLKLKGKKDKYKKTENKKTSRRVVSTVVN